MYQQQQYQPKPIIMTRFRIMENSNLLGLYEQGWDGGRQRQNMGNIKFPDKNLKYIQQ